VRTADGGFEVCQPEIGLSLPDSRTRQSSNVICHRGAQTADGPHLSIWVTAIGSNRPSSAAGCQPLSSRTSTPRPHLDAEVARKTSVQTATRRASRVGWRSISYGTIPSPDGADPATGLWRTTGAPTTPSAMREAEAAIREVLEQSQPVELPPQNNYLRRLPTPDRRALLA